MSTYTYPGVYIEELPSAVHTITGVATSIAAFVGWAPQGPTTDATLVNSWPDYDAAFGGLDGRSLLGYSVNQFFANGGTQAYIVRLMWDGSVPAAAGTNPAVGATAVATGVGYATATITAKLGSIVSAPAALSVGPAVLQHIAIAPSNLPPIPLGATVTFSALGSLSDGSAPGALATVTWASSDPTVVTIVAGGAATAVGPGTATLTATSGLSTGSLVVSVTAATLTTLTITPNTPPVALAAGKPKPAAGLPQIGPQQQLAATGTYSDGTSRDLTSVVAWSTSDDTMAAVGPTGLVTASSVTGTPTIKAEWAGKSATETITIGAAAVTGIVIHPAAPVAGPTQTVAFTASPIFSDGSVGALVGPEQWTSANPAVATIVAATGVATAVAPGTTTITVQSDGRTASATLVVTAATLNSVSVTPVNATVATGLTLPLRALGIYSDGTTADLTSSATWSSASADATVGPNSGVVTGVAVDAGVVVTALWATVSGTTTVAVTAPVVRSIAVTPNPVNVAAGATSQLKATATLSDGSTQDVTTTATWTPSGTDSAVVAVSPTGLATVTASGGTLTLFAANPGAWGNALRVSVTANPTDPKRFGLLVQRQSAPGQPLQTLESFTNLSTVATDAMYAVSVVDNTSRTITFVPPGSTTPVAPTAAPSPTVVPLALSGGDDGAVLVPATDQNFELAMTQSTTAGIALLDRIDLFNLLCVPGESDGPTISTLQKYCADRRAFYLVDAPELATFASLSKDGPKGSTPGGITGANAKNSAFYFPWVLAPDPLAGNRPALFPPCGFVAGLYAATDANRGVWKAPAGIQATLTGASGLQYNLTDLENGNLNVQGINCLREFKVYGDVVWGARTLQGNDQAGSEWKYVPIRRLALYLESSLYQGTQWVVFEPNDVPLWSQIRLNVGAFMQRLFLEGAFQGTSPQQAYFVKCDAENNPQASIDLGVVNILVGFAPLYPAEFVVIQIQQIAGQLA